MTLSAEERFGLLTAPGAAFALGERVVDGRRYQAFDAEPRTLRDVFLAMGQYGGARAIVYQDEYWTFDDLWSEMVAVAEAMSDQYGIEQGDRVGIAMRNYPEFIVIFGAIQLLGAVGIPFNAWLKGAELGSVITEAAPRLLFADRERIASVTALGVAGPGSSTPLVGVRCEASDGVIPYVDLLTTRRPAAESRAPSVDVDPDDVSTILFTSGTTGRPKAAVHTHLNHSTSLLSKQIKSVRVEVPDAGGLARVLPPVHSCKLLTYPLFHISGISTTYATLFAAGTLVLMYKWNAEEAVQMVERERVNQISGPPFVIQTFLGAARESSRDLGSLRTIGTGGAASPVGIIEEIHAVLGDRVEVTSGYGLTETTSGVVAISGRDFALRPDSAGKLLATTEIGVFDSDGERLGVDEKGEVGFRGPQVIQGYAGAENDPNFRDGWFLTGDLGRVDKDGFLYLVGRAKDIVIRGGENISCAEVEACLDGHPDVIESAALAAPHATLGEELVAIVHVVDGSGVDTVELRAYAAEHLAAFKVPIRLLLVHANMPRTASGKITKRELANVFDLDSLLSPT